LANGGPDDTLLVTPSTPSHRRADASEETMSDLESHAADADDDDYTVTPCACIIAAPFFLFGLVRPTRPALEGPATFFVLHNFHERF
jgi:hypothetical protein